MDYITRNLTLDQVKLPDWAMKAAEDSNKNSLVRKGISQNDLKMVEGERSAIFVATSATLDRDNEIVVPKNLNIKNFLAAGSPIQWAHKYDSLGIGSAQWVKYDKNTNSVLIKVRFGKHQFANDVYEHLKEHPLSMSIGFVPTKIAYKDDISSLDLKALGIDSKDAAKARAIFLESELLEASIVPVPSNPSSSMLAVSKGLISNEEVVELGYVYEIQDFEIESEQKEFEIGDSEDGKQEENSEIKEKECECTTCSCIEEKEVTEEIIEKVAPPVDEEPMEDEDEEEDTACSCPSCGATKESDGVSCSDILCEECNVAMADSKACGDKRKPKKDFEEKFLNLISKVFEIKDVTDIGEVIIESLEKLENNKELIQSIRDGQKGLGENEGKTISQEDEIINTCLKTDESEENSTLPSEIKEINIEIDSFIKNLDEHQKSGRVLSDKNRKLVQDAISALSNLLNASEPKMNEEKIFEIRENEKSEDDFIEIDMDENQLVETIKRSLSNIKVDFNLDKLIEERVKRAKGIMF